MREFQERKIRKKRIYSLWSLLGLLILIVLFTKGVISVYQKESQTKQELKRLEAQKIELENRYTTISTEADRLKTDVGIESEIRQKFDVAKPGEGVIVIVDKTVQVPVKQKGFVDKVWDSVKNVFQ